MYITVQNMIDGLGAEQLTRILDVDSDADVAANAMLLQKLSAANGMIESYVSNAVSTPLTEVPAQLIEHGVAIANWFLVASRPEVQRENDRDRYNDALKYLRDISSGVGSLDLGNGVVIVSGARTARMNENLLRTTRVVRLIDPNVDPEGRL